MAQGDEMAVWWVFQNESYERSREGGYLWAPLVDKAGHKKSHWETMAEVKSGDVIISCRDRKIVATSVAKSAAYLAEQPDSRDAEFWTGNGRRVDVAYVDLPDEVPLDELADLFPRLQLPGGPLASTGRGKQGFLFAVHPRAAQELFNRLDRKFDLDVLIASGEAAGPAPATANIASRTVRLGQQKFRERVVAYWGGKCAITGIEINELLIASHIVPWRLANDAERLDPANGLLLEARYDRLFDAALISFDKAGSILISPKLDLDTVRQLGIDMGVNLRRYPSETAKYLQFHRELLFMPG